MMLKSFKKDQLRRSNSKLALDVHKNKKRTAIKRTSIRNCYLLSNISMGSNKNLIPPSSPTYMIITEPSASERQEFKDVQSKQVTSGRRAQRRNSVTRYSATMVESFDHMHLESSG